MLQGHFSIRVVGQTSDHQEALRLLDNNPCRALITGLGERGLALIGLARHRLPALPILVLTRHKEDDYVVEALGAGVNGYILKTANCDELVKAIHEVAGGGSYLDPAVSHTVLRGLRNRHSETVDAPDNGRLSHREKEILTLLARGLNNNQVAGQLHLSLSTVKSHLRTAYRKLSALDRTQAVLKALQLRLIPDPPGHESLQNRIPVGQRS